MERARGSTAQSEKSVPKPSHQHAPSRASPKEKKLVAAAPSSLLLQRPPLKRSLTMEAEALTASFAASQSPEAVQAGNLVRHSSSAPSGAVPPAAKRTREESSTNLQQSAASSTAPTKGDPSLEMRNRELVASVVQDWLLDLLPASVQANEERFGQIYTVAYKVRSPPLTFLPRLMSECVHAPHACVPRLASSLAAFCS